MALEGNVNPVGVPEAITLTGAQLNEENESKLAIVNGVTLIAVNEGSGWANYTASDGTEFLVRDETGTFDFLGTTYDSITGIVQQFDNDYQIIPRGQADIVVDASAVQPVTASPTPGLVPAGTKVSLNKQLKMLPFITQRMGQNLQKKVKYMSNQFR